MTFPLFTELCWPWTPEQHLLRILGGSYSGSQRSDRKESRALSHWGLKCQDYCWWTEIYRKTTRCWLDENPSSISTATITESLYILESFGTSCNLSYEFAIDNKPITIKGLGAKDKQMESGKQFRCFPCRCRQVNQICSFLKQRKDRALHHSVCTLVCCYYD